MRGSVGGSTPSLSLLTLSTLLYLLAQDRVKRAKTHCVCVPLPPHIHPLYDDIISLPLKINIQHDCLREQKFTNLVIDTLNPRIFMCPNSFALWE